MARHKTEHPNAVSFPVIKPTDEERAASLAEFDQAFPEPMTYVRIKAFKLETSRGKMKQGMDIDLPDDEAAKFIASGDAEAI